VSIFVGPAAGRSKRDAFPYPEIPPNSASASYSGDFSSTAPASADSAMRKVAIWSSVNLLTALTGEMPISAVTGPDDARRTTTLPPFFANPDGSAQGWTDWVAQLFWSWLTRGNAVGDVVETDAAGRPTQIVLQHPDFVQGWREASGEIVWHFGGKRKPTEQVWHRRVYPTPGRLMGMSPIERHAVTIGQGLAASAFGWRFFTDGGHPTAILQNEMTPKIPEAKARSVKDAFLSAVRGTREPVVMGSGWKYQQIQVNPSDSQFIDTMGYSAAECCRIYGPGIAEVLGYETGGSLTYSSIESRRLDLLTFTLDPWLTRLEDILSNDVMTRPRRLKLDRTAILRTDLLNRYRAGEIGIRSKFLTINEVRAAEDLPPVEWGDEPVETTSTITDPADPAAEPAQTPVGSVAP
jgi:HK97 family phage portal protein